MKRLEYRVENWNGHEVRFVEKSQGDWWAVASDIAKALDYGHTPHMIRILEAEEKGVHIVDTPGGRQELVIISEFGIYDVIFNSRKPEAKGFKRWVFETIRNLRQASGLEGFQIFRMLDKQHQRNMMSKLCASLQNPVKLDFIKANTITNKTISTMYGIPKMIKKCEMTPRMLMQRQQVLEDTVALMGVADSFGLPIAIAQTVYGKYAQ